MDAVELNSSSVTLRQLLTDCFQVRSNNIYHSVTVFGSNCTLHFIRVLNNLILNDLITHWRSFVVVHNVKTMFHSVARPLPDKLLGSVSTILLQIEPKHGNILLQKLQLSRVSWLWDFGPSQSGYVGSRMLERSQWPRSSSHLEQQKTQTKTRWIFRSLKSRGTLWTWASQRRSAR